jgi:hypothetical protein
MQLLISKQQAAQLFGTTTRKIDRLTAQGQLQKVKLGRATRGAIRDNRPTRYKLTDVLALAGISLTDYKNLEASTQLEAK